MSILLKNAKVFDNASDYHLSTVDIKIEEGVITQIDKNLPKESTTVVVDSDDLCISPGWLDIGSFNGEPGYESLEDLNSLKRAAAAGGFIHIATLPNTYPAIDSKSQINYLQKSNGQEITEVLPLACATKGAKGEVLSELIDLDHAGSIAYTDGPKHKINRGQLMRILQYLKRIDGTYIHYLRHDTFVNNGQINEGPQSIKLGLVGLSKTEEVLEAINATEIARYAECHINLHNVSCMDVIHQVSYTDVSYSVPFLNLIYSDEDLSAFDTNLKVLPPLRSVQDQKGLVELINNGTINCINSNHIPVLKEHKDKEFGMAEFGSSGIQNCYAALNTSCPDLNHERLIECLSQGSYDYLNLIAPQIKIGEKAKITAFDLSLSTGNTASYSKCSNDPFKGQNLKGKIIGLINGAKNTFI